MLLLQTLVFFVVSVTASSTPHCKATPPSATWPSSSTWASLNASLDGRLLQPAPPAAVCHASWPQFNALGCYVVATQWSNQSFHAEDPVSVDYPNWTNDSCLPNPAYKCSALGYPVYVVNATTADHVARGVKFAGEHNVRLNVKGSGHDYLGRSTAPNSLSIWTRHIRGISFHKNFTPQSCSACKPLHAVTLGAGEEWGDIYSAAHARNLTFVGGTGDTIGVGGYITGGGHSPLSAFYGLAADQVLEMQVVTPTGDIVVANQAMHSDLFWALRGGGGATFGVITSVTIKTFPELPVAEVVLKLLSPTASDAWWDSVAYTVQHYPALQHAGLAGYTYISPPNAKLGALSASYAGSFLMPNGTVVEAKDALNNITNYVHSTWPGKVTVTVSSTQHSSLYGWYSDNKNTETVGVNVALGSRLLGADALATDRATLVRTMKATVPSIGIINLNLVAGPGTWRAKPAGGSDAVLPAWRKSYVEYIIGMSWAYFDTAQEHKERTKLTHQAVGALRDIAPDSGCYLNEADVNEPDFQHAFWGSNYERLLSIKRKVDPNNVLWCQVCVGSEGWEVVNGALCRKSDAEKLS